MERSQKTVCIFYFLLSYLLNKVVPAMGLALYKISLRKEYLTKRKNVFSSGFEPETFRVLGGCDNQLHHENA